MITKQDFLNNLQQVLETETRLHQYPQDKILVKESCDTVFGPSITYYSLEEQLEKMVLFSNEVKQALDLQQEIALQQLTGTDDLSVLYPADYVEAREEIIRNTYKGRHSACMGAFIQAMTPQLIFKDEAETAKDLFIKLTARNN